MRLIFLEHKYIHSATVTAFFSVLIVVCLFPAVVFRGGSLQISHMKEEVSSSSKVVQILPSLRGSTVPSDGLSPLPGVNSGLESGQAYLSHSMRNGHSPYWNPYSGAGMSGFETMYDAKSSPVALISSLFGGGTLAFHVCLLFLYAFSIYHVMRICIAYCRLPVIAAIGAAFFFLLNGFSVSSLSASITQAYYLAPFLLHALLAMYTSFSVYCFVIAVLAYALFFSVTYIPVLLVLLVSIELLAFGYMLSLKKRGTTRRSLIAFNVIGMLLGAALVLPIWLPFWESYRVLEDLSFARQHSSISIANLFSFFTPKHYWEVYNGLPIPKSISDTIDVARFVPHFGIVSALVASCAFIFAYKEPKPVRQLTRDMMMSSSRRLQVLEKTGHQGQRSFVNVAYFLLFFAFAGLFDIPPIDILNQLPLLVGLQGSFWGAVVGFTGAFIIAFGIQSLKSSKASLVPLGLCFGLIISSIGLLYTLFGLPTQQPYYTYFLVSIILLVLTCVLILICLYTKRIAGMFTPMLVMLLCLELLLYANHKRVVRTDFVKEPPQYVKFLLENIGDGRVFAIGGKNTLSPEWGSAYGLAQIQSSQLLVFPWYNTFWEKYFAAKFSLPFKDDGDLLSEDGMELVEEGFDIAGVKYILVPKSYKKYHAYFKKSGYKRAFSNKKLSIYTNKDYLPRLYAVSALVESKSTYLEEQVSPKRAVFTSDPNLVRLAEQLEVSFTPRADLSKAKVKRAISRSSKLLTGTVNSQETAGGTVYSFSSDKITPTPPRSAKKKKENNGGFFVNFTKYNSDRVVVRARFREPSIVVFSDTWHPNWRVYVGGQERYLGLVNGLFRGIPLPPGEHYIEYRYRPNTLLLSQFVSCVVAVGLVLALINYMIGRGRSRIERMHDREEEQQSTFSI